MKILAIDPGARRVGLAACDALGVSTQPLPVLTYSHPSQMIQELTGVIRSEAVQRAIIGLPLNMDGTAGLAAERSRQLAAALTAELKRQGISCEILLWDERLTSYEAEMRLRERGIAKGKAKDILDSLAAEVLLEDYLAHHRADLPDDPETKEPS